MELLIGGSPGISDFCLHLARPKADHSDPNRHQDWSPRIRSRARSPLGVLRASLCRRCERSEAIQNRAPDPGLLRLRLAMTGGPAVS
jgi:hypothetical protein